MVVTLRLAPAYTKKKKITVMRVASRRTVAKFH